MRRHSVLFHWTHTGTRQERPSRSATPTTNAHLAWEQTTFPAGTVCSHSHASGRFCSILNCSVLEASPEASTQIGVAKNSSPKDHSFPWGTRLPKVGDLVHGTTLPTEFESELQVIVVTCLKTKWSWLWHSIGRGAREGITSYLQGPTPGTDNGGKLTTPSGELVCALSAWASH